MHNCLCSARHVSFSGKCEKVGPPGGSAPLSSPQFTSEEKVAKERKKCKRSADQTRTVKRTLLLRTGVILFRILADHLLFSSGAALPTQK